MDRIPCRNGDVGAQVGSRRENEPVASLGRIAVVGVTRPTAAAVAAAAARSAGSAGSAGWQIEALSWTSLGCGDGPHGAVRQIQPGWLTWMSARFVFVLEQTRSLRRHGKPKAGPLLAAPVHGTRVPNVPHTRYPHPIVSVHVSPNKSPRLIINFNIIFIKIINFIVENLLSSRQIISIITGKVDEQIRFTFAEHAFCLNNFKLKFEILCIDNLSIPIINYNNRQ